MPDRPGDMDERDVEARFASIVARWDAPVADPDGVVPGERTPAEPDPTAAVTDGGAAPVDDTAEPDAAAPAAPPATPRAPWVNPSPLDVVVPASAWRSPEPVDPASEEAVAAATEEAEKALEEDDEHFEPPEVELPPQEDLSFWGAVIGLVAGPLMLLWVVFARPSHSTRWFVASVVVSLLGFGLLILRQPTHRDPTSGDNGARV
ncbi:MAG: hypothetical protein ACJ711_13445 [Ornithinibacter sp.]